MLSARTSWDHSPNPLTAAADARRRAGLPVRDWTLSNPTQCGFDYPADPILRALSTPASLRYEPDPRGMRSARAAVAALCASLGAPVDPDHILLTASSSEGYAFLFRLLCGPGDEVLVPRPGYPLFDDLARLNDVTLGSYRLGYDGAWHLDTDSLRRAASPRTRAIVAIHPNNPTGNYLTAEEISAIAALASELGVAVVADEVFLTYPLDPATTPRSFHGSPFPLLFTMNGLSKLAGMPQMKLGWIAVGGERGLVGEALRRLEVIADTYLSVNTPVQAALPGLLAAGKLVGDQIRLRVREGYRVLAAALAGSPASVLRSEGGWNAIVQLPRTSTDEEWALRLLNDAGLLAYPGHLFDLHLEACIVVSLLPPECGEYARTLAGLLDRG